MDLLDRRVTRSGDELELTGREYELLEYLLRHKNEVVTRDMIALDVWKERTGAMTRIIDVYINALRKKVDRLGRTALIQTVRRSGICLEGELVRRLSIRWRLTLWYGTVLSVILAGFSGAVYLLMQRHLLTLTDAALSEELAELADEVRRVESLSESARSSQNCDFRGTRVTSCRFELLRASRCSEARASSPRAFRALLSAANGAIFRLMRASRSTAAGRSAWQAAKSPGRRARF